MSSDHPEGQNVVQQNVDVVAHAATDGATTATIAEALIAAPNPPTPLPMTQAAVTVQIALPGPVESRVAIMLIS